MNTVTVENEAALHRLLPEDAEEWTVEHLARMPDDGFRYELFDGTLVVSPAQFALHQRAVRALFRLLDAACPPRFEVFFAPFDFQPTGRRSFQPDLQVVRTDDVPEEAALVSPPILAVEVISTSSRSLDRVYKRSMYAASGIDHYWIFDPRMLEFVALRRDGENTCRWSRPTATSEPPLPNRSRWRSARPKSSKARRLERTSRMHGTWKVRISTTSRRSTRASTPAVS